ncbi:MAG: HAMP domain-containing sensor histidine kinase [Actinomycetota bacterium]
MQVDLVLVVDIVLVSAFGLLAVLAILGSARRRPADRWVALAFGAVAMSLGAFVLPEHLGWDLPSALSRTMIVLLLSFPYLLLRFTGSFTPLPRRWEALSAVGLGVIVLVTVPLPVIPEPGADLPSWIIGYVVLALGYWMGTAAMVVGLLWSAGRGQPTVARTRTRLMAVATAVLTVALLLAAPLGEDSGPLSLLIRLVATISAVMFGLGFSPPPAARLRWRRPEEAQLRAGTQAVLRAVDVEEVAQELLRPTSRMLSARGAALVAADGTTLATHGQVPDGSQVLEGSTRAVVHLPDGRGDLVLWTSPFTPWFGPEEIGLAEQMATVASLAIERCELLAEERARMEAMTRAQAALVAAQEEAVRANDAKTAFLSRTSHELRTPLNAILGFGQVLEDAPELSDRDRDAAGRIVRAGRHLLRLIDEVLDLSRIEAGTVALRPEAVDAAGVMAESIELVLPSARERRVRVHTETGGGVTVRADRQRLRQVLLNLLVNAVKYTDPDTSVTLQCTQPSTDVVRFSVVDDGPGIPLDLQERLFEPFDRLGAEGGAVEGTGLGLVVSRELVHAMDGHMGVRSAPGQGSTFWVDLPAVDLPAEQAVSP